MALTEVSVAGPNDASPRTYGMRAIFDAQRAAFLRAGPPPLAERRADLENLAHAIARSAGALEAAISADFGNRSRHETALAEIFPAQATIRHALRNLARWMRPKRVSVGLELMPATARILYQPVGVVGIISPWNYPFNLAIVPLVAALAAGNRVMLKPSELAPRTAQFIADLLAELFPAEKVATVVGGPETGRAFAGLPFDHLLYTGSTAVGRMVMQAAAENLTPVTLELGGKSPCIVGEDAALPSAVESIVHGKLFNAGQTCIAPDYVLLPEAKPRRIHRARRRGPCRNSIRRSPPIPTTPRSSTTGTTGASRSYIAEAKAQRRDRSSKSTRRSETLPPASPQTRADTGDRTRRRTRRDARGDLSDRCCRSRPTRTLDAGDRLRQRAPRPLALYYFGADAQSATRCCARTISGGASVNTTLLHFAVENLPFGGVGASGHRRLSRRVRLSDLFPSQGRVPAKPPQWPMAAPSAVRPARRHAAEISHARINLPASHVIRCRHERLPFVHRPARPVERRAEAARRGRSAPGGSREIALCPAGLGRHPRLFAREDADRSGFLSPR